MSVVLNPLKNNLLFELEPEPELSQTITVVKAVEGLARFGRVLRVGPEVREIKEGMRVLASITAGICLKDNIHMIAEDAVLAIQHA